MTSPSANPALAAGESERTSFTRAPFSSESLRRARSSLSTSSRTTPRCAPPPTRTACTLVLGLDLALSAGSSARAQPAPATIQAAARADAPAPVNAARLMLCLRSMACTPPRPPARRTLGRHKRSGGSVDGGVALAAAPPGALQVAEVEDLEELQVAVAHAVAVEQRLLLHHRQLQPVAEHVHEHVVGQRLAGQGQRALVALALQRAHHLLA